MRRVISTLVCALMLGCSNGDSTLDGGTDGGADATFEAGPSCCGAPGAACKASSDCCEAMGCVNGSCACASLGERCSTDGDCCWELSCNTTQHRCVESVRAIGAKCVPPEDLCARGACTRDRPYPTAPATFTCLDPSLAAHAPQGELEQVDCDTAFGWAAAGDDGTTAAEVDFYLDRPFNQGGKFLGTAKAGARRTDLTCRLAKGCSHGFVQTLSLPHDGLPHALYAYGVIDRQTATQLVAPLANAPQVFICPSPYDAPAAECPRPLPAHYANIAFIGDSLTGGFCATTAEKDFAHLVVAGLQEHDTLAGAQVLYTGLPGKSAHDALLALQSDASLVPVNEDLVIVEMGTNDQTAGSISLSSFAGDYAALVRLVTSKSPGSAIACLSVWRNLAGDRLDDGGVPIGARPEDQNRVIRQTCAALPNAFYVDISSDYLDFSLHNNDCTNCVSPLCATDTFHPNDAGHALIASQVLDALLGPGSTTRNP